MVKKVIIASKNPVKINSVKIGFEKIFPEQNFEFVGTSVPSQVSDQPLSDEETYLGAKNRCKNSKAEVPEADYWVGIEGGIEIIGNEMQVFAWIVIESKEMLGKAKTSLFYLPKKIVDLINQGYELGDANDIVFNENNAKQKNGTVGMLTDNVITRTSYYVDAVILALIPFKNPEIYLESLDVVN